MLPSQCFQTPYMGATPVYFGAYQQFHDLSHPYLDPNRVHPLSFAVCQYKSSNQIPFTTMATPHMNSGVQFSASADRSPSDANHHLIVNDPHSQSDLPWDNYSDKEDWQERVEQETENLDAKLNKPGTSNYNRKQDSNPFYPIASPAYQSNSSSLKFSIDSILGLDRRNDNCGIVRGSSGKSVEIASSTLGISGVETASSTFGISGEKTVGLQFEQTLAKENGLGFPGALGDACGKNDNKSDEADQTEEEPAPVKEPGRYPWLRCTRYQPPKLPRSKKKEKEERKQKFGRNPRVPFTQHQVAVLEEKFRRTHYLSSMDVAELSSALTLSETKVKIWFQNRRARERREREASQRAQLLSQKPYQPLSIPSVTWVLTSQMTPSSFSEQSRNDSSFRAGLFSSAFNAPSTPLRQDISAEATPTSAYLWPDKQKCDDDNYY